MMKVYAYRIVDRLDEMMREAAKRRMLMLQAICWSVLDAVPTNWQSGVEIGRFASLLLALKSWAENNCGEGEGDDPAATIKAAEETEGLITAAYALCDLSDLRSALIDGTIDVESALAETRQFVSEPMPWGCDIGGTTSNYHSSVAENGEPNSLKTASLVPIATSSLAVDTNPPGLLGEMVQWILKASRRRQPEFALLNSIAALGTIAGRRYRSPENTRTNVYCVAVGPTASGKDASRRCIKALFMKAGLGDRLFGDNVVSGSGLLAGLRDQPSRLAHLDELGKMLSIMANPKAGHGQDLMRTILMLYTASETVFLGNEYADGRKRMDLDHPCFSIFGSTTRDTLIPALASASVVDGGLNRLIILPCSVDYPDPQDATDLVPPPSLVDAVKASFAVRPTDVGNLAGRTNDSATAEALITVGWSPEAKALFNDLDREGVKHLKANHSDGTSPLWARISENSVRVAMIRAIGINPVAPTITIEDAAWAAQVVRASIEYVGSLVRHHIADNALEGESKRVGTIIREAGTEGVTLSRLTRQTRWLAPRRRKEVIADLIEAGQVVHENRLTGGRPALVLAWAGGT